MRAVHLILANCNTRCLCARGAFIRRYRSGVGGKHAIYAHISTYVRVSIIRIGLTPQPQYIYAQCTFQSSLSIVQATLRAGVCSAYICAQCIF